MDWENRYQAGDTPWDRGQAHPLLARIAIDLPEEGGIVVPGCGGGWDLIGLAGRWPGRVVLGLDVAATAVAVARERCRPWPNIRVESADFLAATGPGPGFPVAMIWEHTCFCAIHPEMRAAYVASAAAMLPAGGVLAGVFFLTLDDGGQGPPWNCPEAEFRAYFEPWFEIGTMMPADPTFPGRVGEEWNVCMRRKG